MRRQRWTRASRSTMRSQLGGHRAHLLLYTERAGVVCRLLFGLGSLVPRLPRPRFGDGSKLALALGQRLAHANSLAFALSFAALLHNLRREFAAARTRAEAAIAIASEHHLPQWLAYRNHVSEALLWSASVSRRRGSHNFAPVWPAGTGPVPTCTIPSGSAFIAEAHLRAGQLDDALAALDRATETAAATGECYYQAELYRLRGMVLAETGDAAEAASWFQQAIDTARSQQAKSLELRAATSLARLWARSGQAHRGPRPARAGLWLVHRGLRYRRPQGRQGAARRAGLSLNRHPPGRAPRAGGRWRHPHRPRARRTPPRRG